MNCMNRWLGSKSSHRLMRIVATMLSTRSARTMDAANNSIVNSRCYGLGGSPISGRIAVSRLLKMRGWVFSCSASICFIA